MGQEIVAHLISSFQDKRVGMHSHRRIFALSYCGLDSYMEEVKNSPLKYVGYQNSFIIGKRSFIN